MRVLSVAISSLLWLVLAVTRAVSVAGRATGRFLLRWVEAVGKNPSLARDPGWLAFHRLEERRPMRARAPRENDEPGAARSTKSAYAAPRLGGLAGEPCAQFGVGL